MGGSILKIKDQTLSVLPADVMGMKMVVTRMEPTGNKINYTCQQLSAVVSELSGRENGSAVGSSGSTLGFS